jgi:hypothetical protein
MRSKHAVSRGMELTKGLAVPWGLDDGWELTAEELLLSVFFFFWSLISWQRCARIIWCWKQSCSDFLGLEFCVCFAKCFEVGHSLKWVVKAKRDICLLSLSLSHIYVSQRAPDILCLSIKWQNIRWRTMQADRYATVVHACLLGPEQCSLAWVFWQIWKLTLSCKVFFNHFKTKRMKTFQSSFANVFNL